MCALYPVQFSMGHAVWHDHGVWHHRAVWHDREVWHEPEQFSSELNNISLCSKLVASKDKDINMVDGDSDDALVCCIENTVEDRIMDSGPSFHATYCKEELEKIKLRTSKTLKDVRYISCLKRMLISVGQLNEEGYHIGFRDQQWKVTKGSIVVARGNKRGSLYMVEDWWFGEAEEAFLHNVREDKETTKVGATGVAVGLRISEEEWRGKDTSLTHLKVGAQIRVRGPKIVGASRIVDDQIKNTLNTEYPPRREAPRLHKYEDPPESPGLWVKEEHNSNKRGLALEQLESVGKKRKKNLAVQLKTKFLLRIKARIETIVAANTVVVTGSLSLVVLFGICGGVEKPGGGVISLLFVMPEKCRNKMGQGLAHRPVIVGVSCDLRGDSWGYVPRSLFWREDLDRDGERRITATNKVPLRVPNPLEVVAPKHVVVQIVLWYLDSGCSKHMFGDRSQLTNFVHKLLGTVKFGNDQVAKIMGYGDYQIGNVTISRVYYVEGLGHNLFLVGQFCNSNLEVAFRKHTCFVRNLEGVDLLLGSRGTNLYSLSIGDMMASSPICLFLKATKTKSWLWHRRLSHLNFGAINHLARHGLVRGLPRIKFEKDHLCSVCAMGKSKKQSHKPKSEDTNQEKLYLLHMDLCGPMRVTSVNGKKYILVNMDDYSRFTWVNFLASKDEAPDFIIKFLKMIQNRLNATVRNICTDNGTEFVNQTLQDYYEQVGISHKTLVARTPQQNGVVERRNRTLVEAARTMLIYAKASLFLWAEAVATALFDEFFTPPASVASPVPVVEAPSPTESTSSHSSTTIDQDAPSPSTSQTTPHSQSQTIPLSAEEESHNLEVAYMSNDPYFGIPIPETVFEKSSSSNVISATVHSDALISEHLSK
ncbi:retrovirus-related pol polyprotein from transposon TNT 1-94 [Tanacetum coccineum]